MINNVNIEANIHLIWEKAFSTLQRLQNLCMQWFEYFNVDNANGKNAECLTKISAFIFSRLLHSKPYVCILPGLAVPCMRSIIHSINSIQSQCQGVTLHKMLPGKHKLIKYKVNICTNLDVHAKHTYKHICT